MKTLILYTSKTGNIKAYAEIVPAWSKAEKDFMLAGEKLSGEFDLIAPPLQ